MPDPPPPSGLTLIGALSLGCARKNDIYELVESSYLSIWKSVLL